MAKTPLNTPASVAPASATTTVGGFQIGIIGFIPVDPSDLRKQAEIPMLLLDIQEGRKTIADLAPHLRQMEFRQQHTRKRVPVDEARELFAKPEDGDDDDGEAFTVRDGETGELVEDDPSGDD